LYGTSKAVINHTKIKSDYILQAVKKQNYKYEAGEIYLSSNETMGLRSKLLISNIIL